MKNYSNIANYMTLQRVITTLIIIILVYISDNISN